MEMFARQLDMFFDRRIHTAGASVDVEISLQVAASSRATLINQCGKKREVKKKNAEPYPATACYRELERSKPSSNEVSRG